MITTKITNNETIAFIEDFLLPGPVLNVSFVLLFKTYVFPIIC